MSTPTVTENPNEYTVRDAAAIFGKDPSHIRRLAIEMQLGKLQYGRVRILKKRDIAKLERHFEECGRDRGPRAAE